MTGPLNPDIADALAELSGLDGVGQLRGMLAFAFHQDGSGLYVLAGEPTLRDIRAAKKALDDLLARNTDLFNAQPGGHA